MNSESDCALYCLKIGGEENKSNCGRNRDWFVLYFLGCVCFSFGFLKEAEAYPEKIAEAVSVKSQRPHFNCLSIFSLEIHGSLYIHLHTFNLVPVFSQKN